ncbi:MAG: hypothetical protein KJ893_07580 [Candidatus Omnitrophica bacterium]|nr:hypothetical protein [Candidatus Omnitrophota bacterium]MBU4479166.1 hypothetical protein [Candidatus Omnitrophota bacterium]MCG2703984.1 hypothetical protein [Candidatus Omnitrophota bacterium]
MNLPCSELQGIFIHGKCLAFSAAKDAIHPRCKQRGILADFVKIDISLFIQQMKGEGHGHGKRQDDYYRGC